MTEDQLSLNFLGPVDRSKCNKGSRQRSSQLAKALEDKMNTDEILTQQNPVIQIESIAIGQNKNPIRVELPDFFILAPLIADLDRFELEF